MEPTGMPWRVLDTEAGASQAPERAARSPIDRAWLLAATIALATVLAIGAVVLASGPAPVVDVTGAEDAGAVGGEATGAIATDRGPRSGELVVEVGGAVERPGVYRLPAGSRVADAIEAAGGFGARVDAALADRQLNLAAPLADGSEIRVPARGDAADTSGTAGGTAASTGGDGRAGLVDLNHADAAALDALPGIGPKTAEKIIAAREEQPFATVEDLGTRKVVGASVLARIAALVTVSP